MQWLASSLAKSLVLNPISRLGLSQGLGIFNCITYALCCLYIRWNYTYRQLSVGDEITEVFIFVLWTVCSNAWYWILQTILRFKINSSLRPLLRKICYANASAIVLYNTQLNIWFLIRISTIKENCMCNVYCVYQHGWVNHGL